MKSDKFLVSVLLLSYNAQEYIIDMLNSIKEQTYENLELVIAENGSTDLTQMLISEWLEKNHSRFRRVVFRKNKSNIALTKNINRGLYLCKGKYIKFAYADDILLPDCIKRNYEICEKNNWNVLFSNVKFLEGTRKKKREKKDIEFFELPPNEQYKKLIKKNFVLAPTFFCRKSLLNELGGYDEKYEYLDDYPMWLKMTRYGEKIHYFDEVTVLYRIHEGSLTCESETAQIINKLFYYSDRKLFFEERLYLLFKYRFYREILTQLLEYFYKDILVFNGNVWNRRNKLIRKVFGRNQR